jgi:tetratricopeptide (TPR) repeat protein
LKQDEFVHGLDQATHWFVANQKNVVNGALVLAGAALLLGGLYVYRTRRSETARARFADALEQFHAPVGEAGAAAPEGSPHFATAQEKYSTALASFQKVADDFAGYDAGRQGRYYAGLCQASLKEFEAAEASLVSLRSGDRDLLYYLGSKALAAVKAERKDYAGASELYRALAEDKDNPLPKDYLLFELARSEERAGNREQARQYYDRMLAEHPESQLRGDAMTRSEALALPDGPGASGS